MPKATTGAVLYEQAYLTLLALQDTFLINRIATSRGIIDGQGLLDISLEMIDIVIMFWMKRDELMVFSSGFDWIVSSTLAMEAPLIVLDNLLRYSSCWSDLHGTLEAILASNNRPVFSFRCDTEVNTLHWVSRVDTPFTRQLSTRESFEGCSQGCPRSCA